MPLFKAVLAAQVTAVGEPRSQSWSSLYFDFAQQAHQCHRVMVQIEPRRQFINRGLPHQALQDFQVLAHRAAVKQLRATLGEQVPEGTAATQGQ